MQNLDRVRFVAIMSPYERRIVNFFPDTNADPAEIIILNKSFRNWYFSRRPTCCDTLFERSGARLTQGGTRSFSAPSSFVKLKDTILPVNVSTLFRMQMHHVNPSSVSVGLFCRWSPRGVGPTEHNRLNLESSVDFGRRSWVVYVQSNH